MTFPLPRPLEERLERGVYSELYQGQRVYFAVDSAGARLRIRIVREEETETDVIIHLADVLDAVDPPQRSASARPFLRLVRA